MYYLPTFLPTFEISSESRWHGITIQSAQLCRKPQFIHRTIEATVSALAGQMVSGWVVEKLP